MCLVNILCDDNVARAFLIVIRSISIIYSLEMEVESATKAEIMDWLKSNCTSDFLSRHSGMIGALPSSRAGRAGKNRGTTPPRG